jgi:hypothetical protein
MRATDEDRPTPAAMTNEVDVSTIADGELFIVDGRPPMLMQRRGGPPDSLHNAVNPLNPTSGAVAFATGCLALRYKQDANRVTVVLQRSFTLRSAMGLSAQQGLFIAYLDLQDHCAPPQAAVREAARQAMELDRARGVNAGWSDYLPLALFEGHHTGIVWARDLPQEVAR